MMMPKEIADLVRELELIGQDKITQPQGKSRAAILRGARAIRELYDERNEVAQSKVDC